MVGFYVMMIAVLALSAAAGYTIFSTATTSSSLSLAYQNVARLEQNVSALHQVVAINSEGVLGVPLGDALESAVSDSRMVLPAWVSSSAVTPWGVELGYCPYSPESWSGPTGTQSNVYDSKGLSHSVYYQDDIVTQGAARSYVTSGDARAAHAQDAAGAPEVLAFVISPSNNRSEVPGCADVYWNGQGWAIHGDTRGSVRALTTGALAHSLSNSPRLLSRFVSPTGAGTGKTDADPTTLEMALAEWSTLKPSRMTINLTAAAGTHDLDLTKVDLGSGVGNEVPGVESHGRSLHLAGGPGVIISAGSGSGNLAVPLDMTISGVDFDTNLGLEVGPGARVILADNSSVPSLRSNGAHVVLSTGTSVISQASGPAIILEGGTLTIDGGNVINATGSGSAPVHLDGATFRLNGSLTVATDGSHGVFTPDSSGITTYDSLASLILNGSPEVLGDYPDILSQNLKAEALDIGSSEVINTCVDGALSCVAVCPQDTKVISGSCTANVTNSFLAGAVPINEATGFSCNWSQVSGIDITTPEITAPTAIAFCAPVK